MRYSIIIPTYNKLEECLKPCLESIIEYTNLDEAEVLIVSNGCVDGTHNYIMKLQEKYRNIKLIMFAEAIGYTKAANAGLKASFGRYKVLLNNDTVLLPQEKSAWLRIMEDPFHQSAKVAISGPMKEFSPSAGRDFLIFFCVMIGRDAFEELGPLDEEFSPGYGEDTDWCCRAEDMGWSVVQVPDTSKNYYDQNKRTGQFPIYHKGNVTFKNWPEGDKLLEKNNGILKERYNKTESVQEPLFQPEYTGPQSYKTAIDLTKANECDGFMTDKELTWLAEKAKDSRVFIEIGSWHGKSSRAIADNLPEGAKLYCIDTWKGSSAEQDTWHSSAKLNDGDHAFIEFSENLFDHMQSGKVIPIRMSSKNAASLLQKQGIQADVIFIDAGHLYEEVKEDIQAWKPLVKDGGTLCGHDYYHTEDGWPGVRQAVDEAFGNKGHNMGYIDGNSIWAHQINNTLVGLDTNRTGSKPDVYDCFPFFNELDLLEVRFNELYDVVDRFVISEATLTHGGKPKPLYFAENLHRFGKFLHKVTHIVVDQYPALDSWSIERHQRDSLKQALQGCKDNDIIIMGDADEIPRADVISRYNPEVGIMALEQQLYYYKINCASTGAPWDWCKILTWKQMKDMTPCQVRYTPFTNRQNLIPNAGWHFSYIADTAGVIEKIEASAHQEYNRPEWKIPENIEKKVREGVDIFDRPLTYQFVEIDSTYPKFMLENLDRFREKNLISETFELV